MPLIALLFYAAGYILMILRIIFSNYIYCFQHIANSEISCGSMHACMHIFLLVCTHLMFVNVQDHDHGAMTLAIGDGANDVCIIFMCKMFICKCTCMCMCMRTYAFARS